jgi:hypothetical protein
MGARLAVCLCAATGCVSVSHPPPAYQREIADCNFNPNERDAHIAVLRELVIPDVKFNNTSFRSALDALTESTGILCQTGFTEENQPTRPITLSGRNIRFLDVIDAMCAANGLYWTAYGADEIVVWPANALERYQVRVLPGDANWTNAPCYLFSRELARRGEPPAARNKTVRIMEHETLPGVQFRDTDFKDAVTWLCGQKEVPLLFLAKGGASRHPVSFDMTNAPLFTVLDEICRQSHQYWGFFSGKLAVFSSEEFITDDAWLLPDSFVLTGRPRGPSYKRIFPEEDRDPDENPVMLEKLLCIVNEPVFPKVCFTNTPVSRVLDWLTRQARQSYTARPGPGGNWNTASPVTFSMTNAPFLSAVDAMCGQADWYWGFRGRIFMLFHASVLEELRRQRQDAHYLAFLHSVALPPVTFANQECADIFTTIGTNALAEIAAKNGRGFSMVINPLDPVIAGRKKHTFALKSASVLEAFHTAGEKMNVPVAFKNGCCFIGERNNGTSDRAVADENEDPFK